MKYKERISNEEIIQMIQKGDENRDTLVEMLWSKNIKLVRKIIHRITGLGYESEDFKDMEQQAFIGMLNAVSKYSPYNGVKFFSYAVWYIRKSIFEYYDRAGPYLRIPAYMKSRIRAYFSAQESIRETGNTVTNEGIRKRLNLSDRAFAETMKVIRNAKTLSLDAYLDESDTEQGTIIDMIAGNDDTEAEALKGFYDADLHILLMDAIKALTDIERYIIIARHYQGMDNTKISEIIGCTKQNVSHYANSAYRAIRTGKYREKLLEFLPAGAGRRARKRIIRDLQELTEEEKELLV